MKMISTWPKEKELELQKMWYAQTASGQPLYSALDIAHHFNVTVNAIIGRITRLHLIRRPSPIKRSIKINAKALQERIAADQARLAEERNRLLADAIASKQPKKGTNK
jgi:hypothetical protein